MKIQRKTARADIPSLCMGDIAFNLLIFFVILARAQDESHLQWQPAHASDVQNTGHSKVSVLIDKDEKVYLNGQSVGIMQLASRIEAILLDSPQGERTVLLKVHRESKAIIFEPVIEAISEAGGSLFHIVEKQNES